MSLKVIQDWCRARKATTKSLQPTALSCFLCSLCGQIDPFLEGNLIYRPGKQEFMLSHSAPIPYLGPSGSTCPLSKREMAKLLWAIGSLTLWNKAEFKLGSPWIMAQIPPVSREKGFDYFLFRSEKIYSWSSHNKCWVRLINPSKPTSYQWQIQTYLVHKSQGTNVLCFPSSLAAILNPWGFSFTTP